MTNATSTSYADGWDPQPIGLTGAIGSNPTPRERETFRAGFEAWQAVTKQRPARHVGDFKEQVGQYVLSTGAGQ